MLHGHWLNMGMGPLTEPISPTARELAPTLRPLGRALALGSLGARRRASPHAHGHRMRTAPQPMQRRRLEGRSQRKHEVLSSAPRISHSAVHACSPTAHAAALPYLELTRLLTKPLRFAEGAEVRRAHVYSRTGRPDRGRAREELVRHRHTACSRRSRRARRRAKAKLPGLPFSSQGDLNACTKNASAKGKCGTATLANGISPAPYAHRKAATAPP